ncbi:MAG: cation diffusion facilitator family transporter [Kiritimatiellaeota bacterium]|nr:cation diffusion facilitator family transporter [Kiritimatiellota bacterium]
MTLSRQKKAVAWLSVASNSALVVGKLVIGLLIGSVSVLSEAIHSGLDLVAAGIACYAVHAAEKPADTEHPYGHGKIENISGTVEAVLIFIAALWIIYEAFEKLMQPQPLAQVGLGAAVMGVSCVVNFFVSRTLFRVGRRTHSVALEADAWHLMTDVYTSAGVMAGLLIITLGKYFAPAAHWDWLDPAAAILVAVLILRAAWHLTHQAASDLLDRSLPAEEQEWLRAEIVGFAPRGVCGVHRLRTRRSGLARFIDFHLLVAADMNVADAHALTDEIEEKIEKRFPGASITAHVEPCRHLCTDLCRSGCLLPAEQQTPISAAH